MRLIGKLALAGAGALAVVQLHIIVGHMSSAAVPPSLAGYHRIVITGAPLAAVQHFTSPDATTITGSDVTLLGNYKNNVVQVQFGNGPAVTCQFSSQNTKLTHFTCTGLNQSALVSSTLTITVT
jgi:hypothetical protein